MRKTKTNFSSVSFSERDDFQTHKCIPTEVFLVKPEIVSQQYLLPITIKSAKDKGKVDFLHTNT